MAIKPVRSLTMYGHYINPGGEVCGWCLMYDITHHDIYIYIYIYFGGGFEGTLRDTNVDTHEGW